MASRQPQGSGEPSGRGVRRGRGKPETLSLESAASRACSERPAAGCLWAMSFFPLQEPRSAVLHSRSALWCRALLRPCVHAAGRGQNAAEGSRTPIAPTCTPRGDVMRTDRPGWWVCVWRPATSPPKEEPIAGSRHRLTPHGHVRGCVFQPRCEGLEGAVHQLHVRIES